MCQICEICNENPSKYKCATCLCRYCSLNCWNQHKNKDRCAVSENFRKQDDLHQSGVKAKYFTEDTVREEKLRELGESDKILKILKSKYLQNTLIAVDNSLNPEETIRLAMKDPEFVEFVDECLKVVEGFDL